jgi:hypothetical protein
MEHHLMKRFRLTLFILSALLITELTGRTAGAGGLRVYVAGFGGEFGTLDLSNPSNITYSPIGNTGLNLAGIGFASDGNLYGMKFNFTESHLWRINVSNENTTDLGGIGQIAFLDSHDRWAT